MGGPCAFLAARLLGSSSHELGFCEFGMHSELYSYIGDQARISERVVAVLAIVHMSVRQGKFDLPTPPMEFKRACRLRQHFLASAFSLTNASTNDNGAFPNQHSKTRTNRDRSSQALTLKNVEK
jgi:hypothetical protein